MIARATDRWQTAGGFDVRNNGWGTDARKWTQTRLMSAGAAPWSDKTLFPCCAQRLQKESDERQLGAAPLAGDSNNSHIWDCFEISHCVKCVQQSQTSPESHGNNDSLLTRSCYHRAVGPKLFQDINPQKAAAPGPFHKWTDYVANNVKEHQLLDCMFNNRYICLE